MSRKLHFSTAIVLILFLASAGYGFTTHPDAFIKLDFDHTYDVNTHPGWGSFVLADSGSKVNDVNGNPSGVIIDIGNTASSERRNDPNSNNGIGPGGDDIYIPTEEMYRDFFYGVGSNPLDITLWGLGAERKCKIYIYAYDNESTSRRVANWTANGEELLTTDFEGGDPTMWPIDPNIIWLFPFGKYYDFNGIAYADEVGRIHLTCTEDPDNEDLPFAFANGLVIVTYGDANAVFKAHHPVPFDGSEDVPIDTTLSWIPGANSVSHDVYLGTDPCALVLQGTVDTNSFTPSHFLAMDHVYYWRVDELPGPVTGDVWSFTTANCHLIEDFEEYGTSGLDIRDRWCDYWCNGSSAEVEIEYTITLGGTQSMEYDFGNGTWPPHYSEATFDLPQAGVEIDPNFVGMNVQSVSVWFYGDPCNPVTEQMYAIFSDGNETAYVDYNGDMNDITEEEWQEWSISVQSIIDANGDLDMSNIETIGIGFAEGAPADGTVYFDDIRLYAGRCVLSERSAGFANVDYYPYGNPAGDCAVNWHELEVMAYEWLYQVHYPNNPGTEGLVAYYRFDDFNDANSVGDVFLPDGVMLTRNLAPAPHPNAVWAILSPIDPCDDAEGRVEIIHPGVPIIEDGRPDGNCIGFEADEVNPGERVHCGRWPVVGNFVPGEPIHGEYNNSYKGTGDLTLSIWAKWAGPKVRSKSQGLISKRAAWDSDKMIWMFECDTLEEPSGSFGLRQKNDDYSVWSPGGILDGFIGQWVHLAATYHGSIEPDVNTARLYLNGAEVISGPFYFSGGDPNGITMTIGNNSDIEEGWSVENFHGELDEAHIFNRALEPDEIAYLATLDRGPGPFPIILPLHPHSDVFPDGTVNFKDFALLANYWLVEEMQP